jgi:hypothetical protein
MIGLRICKQSLDMVESYQIIHLFVDDHWKDAARLVVPMYLGRSDIHFHTLHLSPSSPIPFWLDNPYFHFTDLR